MIFALAQRISAFGLAVEADNPTARIVSRCRKA
jgi:hypothetical protein